MNSYFSDQQRSTVMAAVQTIECQLDIIDYSSDGVPQQHDFTDRMQALLTELKETWKL